MTGKQKQTTKTPLTDYDLREMEQRLLSTPGLSDATKRMIRRDLGMLGPEQETRLRQRIIDNGWRSE